MVGQMIILTKKGVGVVLGRDMDVENQEVSQEIELEDEEDLVAGVMETQVEEEDEVVMFQEVGLVSVAREAMEVVDVGGPVNQTLVIREVVSGRGVEEDKA